MTCTTESQRRRIHSQNTSILIRLIRKEQVRCVVVRTRSGLLEPQPPPETSETTSTRCPAFATFFAHSSVTLLPPTTKRGAILRCCCRTCHHSMTPQPLEHTFSSVPSDDHAFVTCMRCGRLFQPCVHNKPNRKGVTCTIARLESTQ